MGPTGLVGPIATADVNGDGYIDVAGVDERGTLAVSLNPGLSPFGGVMRGPGCEASWCGSARYRAHFAGDFATLNTRYCGI